MNQYHVVLEALPSFQLTPASLNDIYVRSALAAPPLTTTTLTASPLNTVATVTTGTTVGPPGPTGLNPTASTGSANPTPVALASGGAVPLSAFTHSVPERFRWQSDHQGQFPVVTVSFNLTPGASLGVGGGRHRARTRPAAHAGEHSDGLPGRGGLVPGFAP